MTRVARSQFHFLKSSSDAVLIYPAIKLLIWIFNKAHGMIVYCPLLQWHNTYLKNPPASFNNTFCTWKSRVSHTIQVERNFNQWADGSVRQRSEFFIQVFCDVRELANIIISAWKFVIYAPSQSLKSHLN